MIPTALLIAFLFALVFLLVYVVVGLSQKGVDSTVRQITHNEFMWSEGYAFAARKVDAADYKHLPHVRDQSLEAFENLDDLLAIVCTRHRGAYLSRNVTEVSRSGRRIVFNIKFGEALGPTIIEDFIVIQGVSVISAGFDPSQPYPLKLEKGDEFIITQTTDIEGENEDTEGI